MTVIEHAILTSGLISLAVWLGDTLGSMHTVMFNLPFFK